jgi:N-acetylglutamate synthase-like GNAT family acetyltransferase
MDIRKAVTSDCESILTVINDAAQAYRGVIPDDCWHEPYMTAEDLAQEIADGVAFWIAESDGRPLGVMGIQDKGDVALIRHAYTTTTAQGRGIGTTLLGHLEATTVKPILVGTWADASWAIQFYRRNGFTVVSEEETGRLLRTYWSISPRQVETSVVLADRRWRTAPLARQAIRH